MQKINQEKSRRLTLILSGFLVLAGFSGVLPLFQSVPSDPAPTATCAAIAASVTSVSCPLVGYADGNLITMEGQVWLSAAGCGTTITITAFGATWTQDRVDCWNYVGGGFLLVFIAHTQQTGLSGPTCLFSDSATAGQNSEIAIECISFPAQSPLNVATVSDAGGATGGKTCPAAMTCTDTTTNLNQYTIEIISNLAVGATGNSPAIGSATGFTAVNTGVPCSNGSGYCIQSQYNGSPSSDTTAGTTETTTGPATIYMKEVAAGFGTCTGCGIVAVIGSCNFFQLQCWWYSFLFMGLYSGFLLMVASFVKTSPKGKAHIFLSALTYGSLIAVILGVMNIVFPFLMLIVNTAIVLRFRG